MAGKPARMGGAYGYIMRWFAKAPPITLTEATTESCSHITRQSMQRGAQRDQVLYREALQKVIVSKSLKSTQPWLIVPSTASELYWGPRAYKKKENAHTGLTYDKSEPIIKPGKCGRWGSAGRCTYLCNGPPLDHEDEAMPLVEWALTPM